MWLSIRHLFQIKHRYISTACWHANHDRITTEQRASLHAECKINTKRYDGSFKKAAKCKFCPAKCRCKCHRA